MKCTKTSHGRCHNCSCGTRSCDSSYITQEFGLYKLKTLAVLNNPLDPHYCPNARSRHSPIMHSVCVMTRSRWFDYKMGTTFAFDDDTTPKSKHITFSNQFLTRYQNMGRLCEALFSHSVLRYDYSPIR